MVLKRKVVDMKNILLFILICISCNVYAQIDLSEQAEKQKKEAKKKNKGPKEKDGSTSIYLSSNFSYSTRMLKENEGLYAEPLGVRADETMTGVWSFSLGIQNSINKNLFWDGGIGYYQYGEADEYARTDTTFNLRRSYHSLALPLRINGNFGWENIRLTVGVGLLPQMFLKQQENLEIEKVSTKNITEEKTSSKNGFNSFQISALFNVGIDFKLSKSLTFYLQPEVRIQLNSTYDKYQAYIHKGRAFGLNFGFKYLL